MINKIAISKCLSLTTQTLLYFLANVPLGYFQVPVIRDSIHVSKQPSLAQSHNQVVYCKIYTHCTALYCTVLYYNAHYTILSVTVIFFLIYCCVFNIDSGNVRATKQLASEETLDPNFFFIRIFPIIARRSQWKKFVVTNTLLIISTIFLDISNAFFSLFYDVYMMLLMIHSSIRSFAGSEKSRRWTLITHVWYVGTYVLGCGHNQKCKIRIYEKRWTGPISF